MPANSIDALRASLGGELKKTDPVYAAKQLHEVPKAEVVNRPEFIIARTKNKYVLEFGASGKMHEAVKASAKAYRGIDREDSVDGTVVGFDLDDVSQTDLPQLDGAEIIVCGEIIEHLSNPGWFLTRLRKQYPGVPVLITVPNAFAVAGLSSLMKGVENVNKDHVSWYSWRTLKTLTERVGYEVKEFAWYNGKPLVSEGLIFVVE